MNLFPISAKIQCGPGKKGLDHFVVNSTRDLSVALGHATGHERLNYRAVGDLAQRPVRRHRWGLGVRAAAAAGKMIWWLWTRAKDGKPLLPVEE